jgi:predicted phosphodiesterase
MLLPKEDAAVPVMDFEQLHEKIDDKDKAIILFGHYHQRLYEHLVTT